MSTLQLNSEWEREIKFISLFGDGGHRGPYSPYKPCNHHLYIGWIIFPHIDNPQSTKKTPKKQWKKWVITINFKKKISKRINTKKWGHPLSWRVIGDDNSTSVYNDSISIQFKICLLSNVQQAYRIQYHTTIKDEFRNNIWKYDIHDKHWVEEILFQFKC